MIALKELNYDDIGYLRENYPINLDLDMECPIFTYVFFDEENIVGYSQLQVVKNEIKLSDFQCDKRSENLRLFYLKATGLKAFNLGYQYILNENNIYPGMAEKIILDELFKGNCNDSRA
ncbi:MAG: hypothetical protein GX985_05885 [Gallicola sp.]|nr:hypothetical protein [Gallicola sp.]